MKSTWIKNALIVNEGETYKVHTGVFYVGVGISF